MVTTCPKCSYQWNRIETDPPRTTGRGSQWNHIVGHCVQIGNAHGLTWREVLNITTDRAVTKGYPYKTTRFGVEPQDYKKMTTGDASVVIDQLHEDATMEWEVVLVETRWEE